MSVFNWFINNLLDWILPFILAIAIIWFAFWWAKRDKQKTENVLPQLQNKTEQKEMTTGETEIQNIIKQLELDVMTINDEDVSMASLFWNMRVNFQNGFLTADKVFPVVSSILTEANLEVKNEATSRLLYRLRTLELIRDEQRYQGNKGYVVLVATSLGNQVIKALDNMHGSHQRLVESFKYGYLKQGMSEEEAQKQAEIAAEGRPSAPPIEGEEDWLSPREAYIKNAAKGKTPDAKEGNPILVHDNVLWEDNGNKGTPFFSVSGPFCPEDLTPLGAIYKRKSSEEYISPTIVDISDFGEEGNFLHCPFCHKKYKLSAKSKTLETSRKEVALLFEGIRRR